MKTSFVIFFIFLSTSSFASSHSREGRANLTNITDDSATLIVTGSAAAALYYRLAAEEQILEGYYTKEGNHFSCAKSEQHGKLKFACYFGLESLAAGKVAPLNSITK